ncbi:YfiR family protein [Beggiatoa leptomitoformis]|uniref:DUF4154 domain-containing protein n=1 Tax=Beggiatoa leptomitoformis TaxID=288004 RepID=A0A2N9YIK7_9GAMM|nr:YfiR family protein [Beggiatoa leptomitoformis]ALG67535.1 DUF4154 domain-containing protein [Beggiatoa leptomitoformis]AUI70239.1 DUF4154 domain-containing protein [Beggiatoa leptomitoformis]
MSTLLGRIVIFALITLLYQPVAYALSAAEEYEIKATFLYKLGSFLYYPPTTLSDNKNQSFYICILGRDPFQQNIDIVVENQTVHGHAIKVKRLQQVQEANSCHVLFISDSEQARLKTILQALQRLPILTVSDMANFVEQGGMLKFYNEDNKVRLALDSTIINAVAIKPSANLLRVATDISADNSKLKAVNQQRGAE